MPDRPLISILTVVKDDAAGLARTRASLRRQIFRDFEWLVADGGSGPGVRDLLNDVRLETAWLDSRPDGGPFGGMNRAMKRARGQWLLFLNAGDSLYSAESLEMMAAAAHDPGRPGLVFGDTYEEIEGGRLALRRARSERWAAYGMFAHHCAILYRQDLVTGILYRTNLRIAADYAFTLEVLARTSLTKHVPEPVAVFASGGLSRQQQNVGRREQDWVRREMLCIPSYVCIAISAIQFVMASLRQGLPKCYAVLRYASTPDR